MKAQMYEGHRNRDWADLEAERDRYREALEVIKQQPDDDAASILVVKQIVNRALSQPTSTDLSGDTDARK